VKKRKTNLKSKTKKGKGLLKQEEALKVPDSKKKNSNPILPLDRGNDYEIQRDSRENPIV